MAPVTGFTAIIGADDRDGIVTDQASGFNIKIQSSVLKITWDFHLRGMAKAGGIEYFSSNVAVTVQFPSYSRIEGDGSVQSATDTEWTNTKLSFSYFALSSATGLIGSLINLGRLDLPETTDLAKQGRPRIYTLAVVLM